MITITLTIPGTPIAKQSVRASTNRYFQNGTHWCPWCKQNIWHNRGDVVTFKNKITGNIDVIIQMYQDSKYTRLDKAIKAYVSQQLPKNFLIFTKEVHIEMLDFVFPILSSFTKKKIHDIEKGEIIYKTVKPDVDNLRKPLFDALTKLVWNDDALIVSENKIRKIYGIVPCTKIKLTGE